MDAEFVLKNASVIEGSGLAPYKGHIHIVDGEIKAVIKEDSKLPEEKIEIIKTDQCDKDRIVICCPI